MRLTLLGRAAAALVLLPALPVHAHDTWVRPLAATLPVGGTAHLHLTSGMAFPVLESPVAPERLARAELRLAGVTTKLTGAKLAKRSLALSAPLPKAGIATVTIALLPRRLELDEAHVAEYLDEIGLAATTLPEWRKRPQPRRWRETYRKLAKTFVRVGEPGEDRSALEPVGLPLELVPDADPTALATGATLSLRLLKAGAPFPGVAIAAVGGAKGRTLATTDGEGRVSFGLDAAGPWMFAATDLRALPSGEWESDFTTLVVAVTGAPSPSR